MTENKSKPDATSRLVMSRKAITLHTTNQSMNQAIIGVQAWKQRQLNFGLLLEI